METSGKKVKLNGDQIRTLDTIPSDQLLSYLELRTESAEELQGNAQQLITDLRKRLETITEKLPTDRDMGDFGVFIREKIIRGQGRKSLVSLQMHTEQRSSVMFDVIIQFTDGRSLTLRPDDESMRRRGWLIDYIDPEEILSVTKVASTYFSKSK